MDREAEFLTNEPHTPVFSNVSRRSSRDGFIFKGNHTEAIRIHFPLMTHGPMQRFMGVASSYSYGELTTRVFLGARGH